MGELRNLTSRLAPHPPKPPEPSASKAGRNLKAAIPVAVLLLALVALSVVWRMEVFAVLAFAAMCIALWEAAGAFLNKGHRIPLIPVWCGLLAMTWATWTHGPLGGFAAFCVAVIAIALWRWASGNLRVSQRSRTGENHRGSRNTRTVESNRVDEDSRADENHPAGKCHREGDDRCAEDERRDSLWVEDAVASIFALSWVGLLGSFAVALAGLHSAEWMIALLILMPAASDTGGWAFGVLWGRHPMSPSVSPKKSWEGFVGSLVVSIASSFVLVGSVLGRPWPIALLVGVAAVLCSTVGDLSESLLKRDLEVKDMGSIFPGHGGMLDRIDSILMWAPVCYAIMTAPFAR